MTIQRCALATAMLVTLAACGGTTSSAPTPAAAAAANANPAQVKNACALFDRADIEAIAGQTLETLHDREEENKTTCEVRAPGKTGVLVYVTVHWTGGKELARINQSAMSMARQKLDDEDVDIMEITGSEKTRGLADKAFYSNVMPSWVLKDDVLIEILSPGYGYEKTKAVFLAVAKKAISRL